MQTMCGADLSDLEEEKPKDREEGQGKKTERDKGKKKP
jgi:hypothetical protein